MMEGVVKKEGKVMPSILRTTVVLPYIQLN